METIIARTNESAPEGMYWVFTRSGAYQFGKTPGATLNPNPYIAPIDWVRKGYVRPEELE